MKVFLVGYTGFVGSNLCYQYKFDRLYNSKNVQDAYAQNPDLLVYSAVPAQKFLANKEPEKDYKVIEDAIYNIKQINPKKIILISTIDVYKFPFNVDEDSKMEESNEAYGRNRLYLEEWVKKNYQDYLIVRLPALYGENIKKNYIYDLINIIPSMLKEEKFKELVQKKPIIENYYTKQDNGFYKCNDLSIEDKKLLKSIYNDIGFSALNFTDSRAKFQFYNLANLWHDINIALNNNLKIVNLATEPITASELYKYIYGSCFINELDFKVPSYDFKTKHDKIYNGSNGYILGKNAILEDIKTYVKNKTQSN